MKVCNKCGKQYVDDGAFCTSCGGALIPINNTNGPGAANGNYANRTFNNSGVNYQNNIMYNDASVNYKPNTKLKISIHLIMNLAFDFVALLSAFVLLLCAGDQWITIYGNTKPYESYAIVAMVFAIIALGISSVNLGLRIFKRSPIDEMAPQITRAMISIALLVASITLLVF